MDLEFIYLGWNSQLQGCFPGGWVVKNLSPMQETLEMQVWPLGQEDPLEREIANPFQYSCLENPMDWGGLAGCNPWGHKALDRTEHACSQFQSCPHISASWNKRGMELSRPVGHHGKIRELRKELCRTSPP